LNDWIVKLSFFKCNHKFSIDNSSFAWLTLVRNHTIGILKLDVFIMCHKSSWFRKHIQPSYDSLFSKSDVEDSTARLVKIHFAELQNQSVNTFFIQRELITERIVSVTLSHVNRLIFSVFNYEILKTSIAGIVHSVGILIVTLILFYVQNGCENEYKNS